MAFISFIDAATMSLISTFLFVFAVVFGLLVYSKVADFSRRINAIIALAVGFFAIMYEPLVTGLTEFMPIAVGILIVLFFAAFIKKVLGGGDVKDSFPIIVVLGILLLLMGLFSDRVAVFLPAGLDANSFLWIVGIVIAVLFFWFIYKYKSS